MTAEKVDGPHQEALVFARAVENVFRKLIRLLIGRMSLTKLQEMIRIIFVEEAEAKLTLENSEARVSLSRLGALTNLDTRTLKKIRNEITERKESANHEGLIGGFNPLLRVFDLWMNDGRFFDFKNSSPRKLRIDIDEGTGSFGDLVKASIPARGVTVKSVLQRLKNSGLVIENPLTKSVEIVKRDGIFISKVELDMLQIGLDAATKLLSTVFHNIQNRKGSETQFFQRSFWNYQIDSDKLRELRGIMHAFLSEAENSGRELLTFHANEEIKSKQHVVGLGLFYFESE